MSFRLLIFLVTSSLLAMSGCTPSDDEGRLGIDGEVCFTDTECREGLLCSAGLCTASERASGCSVLCNHMADCGQPTDGCESNCTSTTDKWRDAAFDEFIACVPSVPCSEVATGGLDRCLPAIPADRAAACDDLAYAIERACGRGEELRDTCTVAAASLPDTTFDAIATCSTDSCEAFFPCQESIW